MRDRDREMEGWKDREKVRKVRQEPSSGRWKKTKHWWKQDTKWRANLLREWPPPDRLFLINPPCMLILHRITPRLHGWLIPRYLHCGGGREVGGGGGGCSMCSSFLLLLYSTLSFPGYNIALGSCIHHPSESNYAHPALPRPHSQYSSPFHNPMFNSLWAFLHINSTPLHSC